MVNKIAFIIPTYPPHFNYAKNFLETFRKNSLNLQADLFFIFSDATFSAVKIWQQNVYLNFYLLFICQLIREAVKPL